MFTLQVEAPDFLAGLKAVELDVERKIELVLRQVGIETVAYLRSLTSEMRPPVRAGQPPRRAHPGHWADVTGQLANSYGWSVDAVDGGWQLTLQNSAGHAVYLENRDGFFVLTGVTDPGGPVERAIRTAAAAIAPEWTVRLG